MTHRPAFLLIIICAFLLATPTGVARAGLEYATFVGGSAHDYDALIDLDSQGNVVLLGHSWSEDFPTTPGAFDETHGVLVDIVIAKLTPDLSTLLAATYLGGDMCTTNYYTGATGLAVGLDDAVSVAGWTECDGYPVTPDAALGTFQDGTDGILTQLSPDLETLLYSTFVAVEGYPWEEDACTAMALTSDGHYLVAGYTFGNWYWIIKYAPDLINSPDSASGYWLGPVNGLAVDLADDSFFAVGSTEDPAFETTPGAWDTSHNGGRDAFVLAFDPTVTLQAATFLGGAGNDSGIRAGVDASGIPVVAGYTLSDPFPTTGGAYDTSANGGYDAYAAWFSADLSSLEASTLLGGSGNDYVMDIGLTGHDTLALAGYSTSTDFPVTAGAHDETSVTRDGVIAELPVTLDRLLYATYLGGDVG